MLRRRGAQVSQLFLFLPFSEATAVEYHYQLLESHDEGFDSDMCVLSSLLELNANSPQRKNTQKFHTQWRERERENVVDMTR